MKIVTVEADVDAGEVLDKLSQLEIVEYLKKAATLRSVLADWFNTPAWKEDSIFIQLITEEL